MTLSSACFVVIGGYIGDREPRPHTRLLKGNLYFKDFVSSGGGEGRGGGGENVNREFEKTVRMYINNHLRCSNQNKKSL